MGWPPPCRIQSYAGTRLAIRHFQRRPSQLGSLCGRRRR
ncbi:MAG: hypothetical protein DWQ37_06440 [Planctomycetota bacterium]|nr:MAG: hypothetical protein DWQ37_06440 [Planctomycetota bacterium]